MIELINPNVKKIKDIIKDHNLKSLPLVIGYNAMSKKLQKNYSKILFELVLIFCSILIIQIL